MELLMLSATVLPPQCFDILALVTYIVITSWTLFYAIYPVERVKNPSILFHILFYSDFCHCSSRMRKVYSLSLTRSPFNSKPTCLEPIGCLLFIILLLPPTPEKAHFLFLKAEREFAIR